MTTAYKTLQNILKTKVADYPLKWCFVNENKLPFQKDGTIAKLNNKSDFCDLNELVNDNLKVFKGLGISINYSNVCAIDVDKCFSEPFKIDTIDERGKWILDLFKDYYCEFSFSGTGLRILFLSEFKGDFRHSFYIKHSKYNIEFYMPHFTSRYVTITGKYIYNNSIKQVNIDLLLKFLNKYMLREEQKIATNMEDKIEDDKVINKRLKKLFKLNSHFLDVWTSQAKGSGRDESENDYYLILMLYQNVSSNRSTIKSLFEKSDYYLSKDARHLKKWNQTTYFERTMQKIRGS